MNIAEYTYLLWKKKYIHADKFIKGTVFIHIYYIGNGTQRKH